MEQANDISLDSVSYRRFTDSQLDRLHQATLEILESIGIHFQDPGSLEIFRKGGAVIDGDIVKIPSQRVEWALRTVPKKLILYDQTGQATIRLEGRKTYYGNGSDLLSIIDHRTKEHRLAKLQDVVDCIRILDALENIDYVMSGFLPRDVPVDKAELLQMQVMLQYTDKPILFVVTDLQLAQRVVAMAEVVAGGEEEFRQRPFAASYINMANPLRHDGESIQQLIWLSEKGLPFTYRPGMVTRGVSTPITGAGFLAVQSAAGLAGLVLSQLVREGTPFIRDACSGGTFDMKRMVGLHAAPEIRGFNEELLHYYRLPGFGIGGNSGSKDIDTQAALEAAMTLVTSTQAGAHLLHDVGYLDNGKTGSLVQLVICNEIIGWIKAYMKPLYVNDQTLALDAVRDVVNKGGDFLGSDNTVKHFREDYYPRLLDRTNYETWEKAGSKTLTDRAVEYVDKLLAMPVNERLTEDQLKAIQTIMEQ